MSRGFRLEPMFCLPAHSLLHRTMKPDGWDGGKQLQRTECRSISSLQVVDSSVWIHDPDSAGTLFLSQTCAFLMPTFWLSHMIFGSLSFQGSHLIGNKLLKEILNLTVKSLGWNGSVLSPSCPHHWSPDGNLKKRRSCKSLLTMPCTQPPVNYASLYPAEAIKAELSC